MAITDWPADERPREKLLTQGASSLSDAELLAIFLRTGTPGQTAVDLARQLLNQFKGLRPLLEAKQSQFCAHNGLGPAKFAQLQAVLEMARRHLQQQLTEQDAFTRPELVFDFVSARLRHLPHEVFACLFLDNQHRLIQYEELFRGTLDSASVYPREVAKRALELNAAAVIFTHNHPSGDATPSDSDRRITERLVDAMGLLDIRVLDHCIVGNANVTSMAQLGQMRL